MISYIHKCCNKYFKRNHNNNETNEVKFSNPLFPKNKFSKSVKYKILPFTSIKLDDSYLKEQLGEGGTAIVYRYNDGINDYACKKITRNLRSMEREIEIMKTYTDHENLPKYYDSFINTDTKLQSSPRYHYLFMEYCQGKELFEVMKDNLDYKLATNIIYQLLLAVKHLQKFNIIHSDIKLENIIINSKNQIKLIDFGLSRKIEKGNAVLLRKYIGTIGYIAPESLLLNYVTLKTDIWSIGVLYYIMLNNRHLFNVLNIGCYKKELNQLTYVLNKSNGISIDNNTISDKKDYINIISFLIKTICYERYRFNVKKCLNSPIFKNIKYDI